MKRPGAWKIIVVDSSSKNTYTAPSSLQRLTTDPLVTSARFAFARVALLPT